MQTLKLTIKKKDDSLDNDHLWRVSRDLWRKGAVTSFLEEQVKGLKDNEGNPLPDHAKQFFMDVLFRKIKLPKKTREKLFSETAVKQVFEVKHKHHKLNNWLYSDQKLQDMTPKEAALLETSELFGISESVVSEIVYPRSARKKK